MTLFLNGLGDNDDERPTEKDETNTVSYYSKYCIIVKVLDFGTLCSASIHSIASRMYGIGAQILLIKRLITVTLVVRLG